MSEFEIELALSLYKTGIEAFLEGNPFDKKQSVSWRSGWKDAKAMARS
jgi:hypothetical protein